MSGVDELSMSCALRQVAQCSSIMHSAGHSYAATPVSVFLNAKISIRLNALTVVFRSRCGPLGIFDACKARRSKFLVHSCGCMPRHVFKFIAKKILIKNNKISASVDAFL